MTEPIILQEYNSLAENCSSKLDTSSALQIIINGVDVSECEYYDSKMNGVCECKNTKEYGTPTRITGCGGCKFNSNCYYKQLKRKEQECKKYKKHLDEIKSEIENKYECLDITIHQISKIINEVENER